MSSSKETKKTFLMFDQETGETHKLITVDEDQLVLSKASLEAFKKKKRLEEIKEEGRGKNWVACYHDPIQKISEQMSLITSGAFMKLLPYLQFKSDGKLMKDGKPLKQKDIKEIIKKSEERTRLILKTLEEMGILTKKKVGRSNVFCVNPEYHSIGEVLKKESFTKLYQGKTKELLEKINLNEAGVLYKMLPYFHYQTYYLCENPDEENPEVIHHLSREELAEKIGIEPETVSKYVGALNRQGIIMIHKMNNKARYIVHPDLMFRKEYQDEYTESVRFQFEQFEEQRKRK